MPVIKNNNAGRIEGGAFVLDLTDLATEARRLAEEARIEALRINAQAKTQAAQLKTEATERGHADGFEHGKKLGYEQGVQDARQEILSTFQPRIEQVIESWTTALGQWDRARQDMLLAAGENVLTFAFEMAQQVIGRAIKHDPTVVRDQVKAALALLSQPTAVTIIVNTEDVSILEEVLPSVIEKMGACEHAQLRPDDSMTRGGCIVRTAGGEVDATIETQIARIAEALLPGTMNENNT